MDKPNSTVERYLRSPTLPDVFVRLTEAKKRKESFSSNDTILKALGMVEGLAEKGDLIFAKLSKFDKLDGIELRFNNPSTSVSSIEMAMGQLEKEVSVLDTKNQDHRRQASRRIERKSVLLRRRYFRFKEECLRH